jgi:hypothetical protein
MTHGGIVQIKFKGVVARAALAAAAVLAVTAGPAAADPMPVPTETSVTASPNPAVINTTVTYSIEVVAAQQHGAGPAVMGPTGSVTLTVAAVPLPGCVSVPLVNGKATCQSSAGPVATYTTVQAQYSGDVYFLTSTGYDWLHVISPATVKPSVAPNPVLRSAAITYKATISGISLGSADNGSPKHGTIAYYVDGELVPGCSAQPVDEFMKSSCTTVAPPAAGTYRLKTVYSGSKYVGGNHASTDFVVYGPEASLPQTVDFGSVTVGEAGAQTVTLTNASKAPLFVKGAALPAGGPFSVVADGCAEKKLAGGETCDVTVAFRPGAEGASYATLGFHHDGEGPASVILSGTGVVPPAPPAPPAPPVVEPPKQPGGTLAPGAKPTLTVSVPSSGNGASASAVPVLSLPLSCPANEECMLNGTLKINTSTLSKSARAAATETQTVARFSKVQVEAGGLKTIKLKLSPAFVKKAQKRGVRKIKATLTINTVLGSGERTTTQQQVVVVIPKAAKKKAAQKARPRFTG